VTGRLAKVGLCLREAETSAAPTTTDDDRDDDQPNAELKSV
jgi:hypothetical protein